MKKEIPKAYEPEKYEDKIYKNWEESGFFNPDNLKVDENAKTYTISLPPPNVTGTLHMGHAGMLAFEDVLIRYHRMRGERALWVPGTDHAAIATQTKVEKIIKEEGTNRHEMGREKFLERVKKYALDSHDTIVNQCRKIGASLDWSREAYTLDKTREKFVNLVFKLMYDDGLIYRGERIVNWCPRCNSTLADDEVEYKETKSKLYYFKYSKDFPISIATTRPETKLGDSAVAVNPKDERYKDLIGKEYEVDFIGIKLKIKIIADRNVDMNFGAGALGVTPAHSAVDWEMAEEHNLEKIKVIDEHGKIRDGFKEYSGLDVKEARKKIVEKLKEEALMEKEEEIDNKLSLCYRCDTLIEPLPSLQWFVDVNKKIKKNNKEALIDWDGKSIKDVCLQVVRDKKINIIPERFEKNYFHWMENLRDWCISRQILFGHQVPAWKRNVNNKEEIYVGEDKPEGEGWERDKDTLDTWFSSGMWTFSTLAHSPKEVSIENGKLKIDSNDFRNFHPTQVLETGYDILFFWVARMIIMTTYTLDNIPFENVYLHGLVLDEKGKKMSKSKGNVIDPLDMTKKYGADATRLSLMIGTSPGNDMKISEEKISGFRNMVNKLWNISRYILQSLDNNFKFSDFQKEKLSVADNWILNKLENLIKKVSDDLDNYRFSSAGESLRDFTWNDLADWYIEATKFDEGGEKNKVLIFVLKTLLKLWHPFIPFVTEAIWKEFNDNDLIIEKWPEIIKDEKYSADSFYKIKNIISAIRNARAENKVEPGRKIKAVIYAGSDLKLIKENEKLIKGMRTGIEDFKILEKGEEIENEIKIVEDNFIIYLIGAIDKEKEILRIKKEKDNLEKQITIIKNKLNNKNFVEKAPADLVKKEREKLSGLEKELKEIGI